MKSKTCYMASIAILISTVLVFQNCKKEEDNKAPSCMITFPAAGQEFTNNEIVTITVNASDSDGNITEVKFYVDDNLKSSVNNAPYQYDWDTDGENVGNHTIKATCIDNEGLSASDEVTVAIISGNLPVASFNATPTSGKLPLTVNFTDQSSNNPTSWLWDFGDGTTNTEQNPTHTYSSMGLYNVSLTVTNDDGSDQEIKTNFIIVKDVFTDDRDGQTYDIVAIGTQIWFAENLNYEMADSWWYKDDEANGNMYGRLYTWDAASMACPAGWHLPSDDEWKTLEMFLGMSQDEADGTEMRGTDQGKKLKSAIGWNSGTAIDEVGFAVLPGGERDPNGNFLYKGDFAIFWTTTPHPEYEIAWHRYFDGGEDRIGRDDDNKLYGFSVRCVKNE